MQLIRDVSDSSPHNTTRKDEGGWIEAWSQDEEDVFVLDQNMWLNYQIVYSFWGAPSNL